ncbi:hypothetical protein GQX74_013712 [Glossina fuscipes]|nr:hypothetical protein GQX74_013712 [Glossina fuscipes]
MVSYPITGEVKPKTQKGLPVKITSTTSSYIDFFIASTFVSTVQYFALNRMGLKLNRMGFNSDHKTVEDVVRYSVSLLSDCTPLTSVDTANTADGLVNSERLRDNHEFVTPSDIRSALKTRNNKKSVGADGIPNFVFKKTTVSTWSLIATLYNHYINIGFYPTSWKKAIVFPVLKPGADPKLVNLYRPISLLPNVGKLFEYFLLLKIQQHLTENKILKDF